MKNLLAFSVLFLLVLSPVFAQKSIYKTETLEIVQLTESSFVHISYLNTNDFGKVACNGLVVLDGGEAFVMDTPVDDDASNELLQWIKSVKGAKTVWGVSDPFPQ